MRHSCQQQPLTLTHSAHVQAKLSELHSFVQEQLTKAASSQKEQYDTHSQKCTFCIGDPLWLSIPTAGKLDSR